MDGLWGNVALAFDAYQCWVGKAEERMTMQLSCDVWSSCMHSYEAVLPMIMESASAKHRACGLMIP